MTTAKNKKKAAKPVATAKTAVDARQDVIDAANALFDNKFDVDYNVLKEMGRKRLLRSA